MLPEAIREIAQRVASLPTLCLIFLIGGIIFTFFLFRLAYWLDKKFSAQPPKKEELETLIIICQLSQPRRESIVPFILPPPKTDFPDKIIDPKKN